MSSTRFVSVGLKEPPKEAVHSWDGTRPLPRLAFAVHAESFAAAGRLDPVEEAVVTTKGGKGVTHESALREAIKAVGGELYIDPYGVPQVVQTDYYRTRLQKK